MGRYPSVFAWWQHLRDIDDAVHDLGYDDAAVDTVLDTIEQLRVALFEVGPHPGRTRRVRAHVQTLMGRYGFTPTQVVAGIGIDEFSEETIISMLAPAGARDDDGAKVLAVALMRQRMPLDEVEQLTGLTAKHQLPYLARELGIEYRVAGKAPASVRRQALAMLAEGATARAVVAHFAQLGEQLTVDQVRKWRQRAAA